MEKRLFLFIFISVFAFMSIFDNISAYDSGTSFGFSGVRVVRSSSGKYYPDNSSYSGIVDYSNITLTSNYNTLVNLYVPDGITCIDGYIAYYILTTTYDRLGYDFDYTFNDVSTSIGGRLFSSTPIGGYPIYTITSWYDSTTDYTSNSMRGYIIEFVDDSPNFFVKVFDVIVSATDYISNLKLGEWIEGVFKPSGSIISVDMGDTVTVTSVDNSVTNVPTTYIQPNISYNGFNTSVNINTNKVVDYMGKSEDTFKSITYNITYEYIDDNSETNTVTYTYNYNYDDKEITYGPESDPDENNSTDDTTITVVQPDGSNNVQNSGGALSTLISTIANNFISAVSGLIGGLSTVVSSLSSLVTSTGGLFNTLGGVISPLYQGTIIGDIVTLLGLSLIATFIIGFFKR